MKKLITIVLLVVITLSCSDAKKSKTTDGNKIYPAQNDTNSHLLTSINGFIGLEYTNFRFGLSYDANLSKIGNTNGVYEFSLTYMSRCRSCPTDRSRKR